MNNLMLTFSAADVSRLRALVATVEKEIALVPATGGAVEGPSPKTSLGEAWSLLVKMLDLGPEPLMRTCPTCKQPSMLAASLCGHCWSRLPALKSTEKAGPGPLPA
jgi:hypothetical protein